MRFEAIFLGATLAALSIAHHPPHPIAANDDGYALAARDAKAPPKPHPIAANDDGYALAARKAKVFHA